MVRHQSTGSSALVLLVREHPIGHSCFVLELVASCGISCAFDSDTWQPTALSSAPAKLSSRLLCITLHEILYLVVLQLGAP